MKTEKGNIEERKREEIIAPAGGTSLLENSIVFICVCRYVYGKLVVVN